MCGRTRCGGGHCFTFLKPPCQQAVKAIHPPCARAFEYTYLITFPEQDKNRNRKAVSFSFHLPRPCVYIDCV